MNGDTSSVQFTYPGNLRSNDCNLTPLLLLCLLSESEKAWTDRRIYLSQNARLFFPVRSYYLTPSFPNVPPRADLTTITLLSKPHPLRVMILDQLLPRHRPLIPTICFRSTSTIGPCHIVPIFSTIISFVPFGFPTRRVPNI